MSFNFPDFSCLDRKFNKNGRYVLHEYQYQGGLALDMNKTIDKGYKFDTIQKWAWIGDINDIKETFRWCTMMVLNPPMLRGTCFGDRLVESKFSEIDKVKKNIVKFFNKRIALGRMNGVAS